MPRVNVFVNPLRIFEWDDPVAIRDLPPDPTPQRLLQFLCTPGVQSDIAGYRERYRDISDIDNELFMSFHEPELNENVFWPLRQAKASYLTGNYVGAISLCGLVGEMMAILIHELKNADESERDKFEDAGQAHRVRILKEKGWISPSLVQMFGDIRGIRNRYLHVWNATESRVREDAGRSYEIANRLIKEAMGISFNSGAITFSPELAEYLKARRVVRQEGEE